MSELKITKHNYTLIEMLFVIGLTLILFNAATAFYFKGRDITRRYAEKAVQIRTASVAAEFWREFVHKNGKPFIVKPDKIIFTNKSIISVNKNKLTFASKAVNKSMVLAKSYSATLEQENPSGEPPLLILYLRPVGSKGQILKDKSIRITACIQGVKP